MRLGSVMRFMRAQWNKRVGRGQGGLIPVSEWFLAAIVGVWRLEGGLGATVST